MAGLFEAMFYRSVEGGSAQCFLCHRACLVPVGGFGLCGVRKNVEGRLYSLVYGKTLTADVDPVEKKPLFHFKPGSHCLSVSTFGCNFFCLHCQNASISQQRNESVIAGVPFTSPERVVENALSAGVEGIAFTFTEPTVFAEYALAVMRLAHKEGLYNVWVSNGYMSKECVEAVALFLDAINIDLKGGARFYKEVCGSVDMGFVRENIRAFHEKGVHVEVTNLVVPGFNDSEKDFKEVSDFVLSVDSKMPLHFTGFSPQYKLSDISSTAVEKLHLAKKTSQALGLKFVYIGNVLEENSTKCPGCGALLVRRIGFSAEPKGLGANGECKACGSKTGFVV